MLTGNLRQDVGLVYSIRGECLRNFVRGREAGTDAPPYIVVKFDGYGGGNAQTVRIIEGVTLLCR